MIPILIIVGIAIGAVAWYSRNRYYVGLDQARVTVYRGVPGGLLIWDPTIESRTRHHGLRPDRRRTRRRAGQQDVLVEVRRRRVRHPAPGPRAAPQFVDYHDDDDHDRHAHHDHRRDPAGRGADARGAGGRDGRMKATTRRRNSELTLGLLAVLITGFGYLLVQLADKPNLPPDLWGFLAAVFGLYVVAHLAVRRFAPNADPTLLPLAALLNGIGFVTISRLDRDLARHPGRMDRRRRRRVRAHAGRRAPHPHARAVPLHVPASSASSRSCCRSFPGIGKTINGARLWVGIGPLNFQPGEAAKVLLVVFFAAYLVDKRELLARGRPARRRPHAPRRSSTSGRCVLAWGVSILIMVRQRDLGSSLLFFAVFAAMLYIATERAAYLVVRLLHVRRRRCRSRTSCSATCATASSPGSTRSATPTTRASRSSSRCSRSEPAGSPAPVSGSATRSRSPTRRPTSSSRRSARSSGCSGRSRSSPTFLLLVGSGFRIAVQAERPFSKLFAAGLTTIIGVQTFVIIGGVTRVIPLTGITLPFISYGGSSLVANFVILALLLRISDDSAAAAATAGRADRVGRRRWVVAREPRHPARRHRGDGPHPRARRAADLPADRRREEPREQPAQRARRSCATSTGPGARSSPPTARSWPARSSRPTTPTSSTSAQYPLGPLFSQIVGYQSFVVGNTGIEKSYNDELVGRSLRPAAAEPAATSSRASRTPAASC